VALRENSNNDKKEEEAHLSFPMKRSAEELEREKRKI
jgi:hypothetical protein